MGDRDDYKVESYGEDSDKVVQIVAAAFAFLAAVYRILPSAPIFFSRPKTLITSFSYRLFSAAHESSYGYSYKSEMNSKTVF